MTKKSIYFLCTGNTCRSQMAEGFAKKYLGDTHEIYSAGIEPREIHPFAIKVMKEKGIDISEQTSDLVSTKLLNQVDFVITLCKDAKERCPAILPRASHYHWAFEDPAKVKGTEDEIMESFRVVRDEIEAAIKNFIEGNAGAVFNSKASIDNDLKQKADFGERIQLIRKHKGLSVKEFAAELKISEAYLSKTENNMTEPSKFFIHRLAAACQMDYDDLIDSLYYVDSSAILKLLK